MSTVPVFHVDLAAFHADPYPDLARMRAEAPIARVPELAATLITRRDDIFTFEKQVDILSSEQPDGLMTRLMGANMMRKDGAAHAAERRAIFPAVSPRTVRDVWKSGFEAAAEAILDALEPRGAADLVADYAMPVSAEALKLITGLTNMSAREMNRVSQGMIDGIANYTGDAEVAARCNDCTASIDRHITERIAAMAGGTGEAGTDPSLLSVQRRAGLDDAQVRANIKLAISGGQNEPRDAIAGTAWALLTHPGQLRLIESGAASYMQAFEEYARWISPIGMSPRRVARNATLNGVPVVPGDRVFLMYGSGNRDAAVFTDPDRFDITRDVGPSLAFGAGPHFCAGAWASRALVAEVALPRLFARLLRLEVAGPVPFAGWAFRGPLSLPVRWAAH